MKVCHIVYAYYPADPRVRREVEALCEEGHEVDVISLRGGEQTADETVHKVRVHRIHLASKRGGRLRYVFQYLVFFILSSALLVRLHRLRRFQLVHVHSLPDFQVLATFPLKAAGVPVVLDLHEAFPEIVAARFKLGTRSPLVQLSRLIERLSVRYANRVVTVNETIRALLLARARPATDVTVVMNSPNLASLKMGDQERLRERFRPDGRPVIIYIGGINRERDLATLLRAIHILRERLPFRVVIAGPADSSYLGSLKDLVRNLRLDELVTFSSPIPHEEVLSILALSDLGVISYEKNPLTQVAIPTKVFEYAAVEKPMVIADLRALRDLFEGAAEFFQPGDSDDLAEAIERLWSDPSRAYQFTAKARAVLENCAWDTMKQRLLRLYAQVGGAS